MSLHPACSLGTPLSEPFAAAPEAAAPRCPARPHCQQGLGGWGAPMGAAGLGPMAPKDTLLCRTPLLLTSILQAWPHALAGTSRDHRSAPKCPGWDLGSGFWRQQQRSGRVQAGTLRVTKLWERPSPRVPVGRAREAGARQESGERSTAAAAAPPAEEGCKQQRERQGRGQEPAGT